MKKIQKEAPDFFQCYDDARNALALSGSRLLLIEAILLLLVMALPLGLLESLREILIAVAAASPRPAPAWLINLMCLVLQSALILFLLLPLCAGFLRMAYKTERRVRASLSSVFWAFSEKASYRCALAFSFRLFWKVMLVWIAVKATCEITVLYFAGSLAAGIVCSILVIVQLFGGFALFLRGFSFSYFLLAANASPHKGSKRAETMGKRFRGTGFRFFFGLLPRLLLGVLTFGILLVWDVLPRASVAYFDYCRQMNEIIKSEEYKK